MSFFRCLGFGAIISEKAFLLRGIDVNVSFAAPIALWSLSLVVEGDFFKILLGEGSGEAIEVVSGKLSCGNRAAACLLPVCQRREVPGACTFHLRGRCHFCTLIVLFIHSFVNVLKGHETLDCLFKSPSIARTCDYSYQFYILCLACRIVRSLNMIHR